MSDRKYSVELVQKIDNPLSQFSEKYARIKYYSNSQKEWRTVVSWNKRYELLVKHIGY